MIRALLMGMFCLVLAGCGGRQPDEDALRSDLQSVLAVAFGEETFKIVELERRGSAKDSTAPEDQHRRVTYFDVELELMRDLALGGWEDPGAASLVSLLGAGPRSIQGVRAGGNDAGDRIIARASAIYREQDGKWSFVMPATFREPGKPQAETGQAPRPAQEALDKLAEITRTIEAGGSPVAQRVVDQELRRSVARISGQLSRIENGYPVAAGPDRGEYAAFASALAEVSREHQLRVLPLITGGSEENIDLLRNGNVAVGLAQADAAKAAFEGSGSAESLGAFASLRALGALYPEYVHIVVNGDSETQTASGLKNARIAMGPAGSAVRGTLERVLAAHGLQAGRDYEPKGLRFAEALPALRRGEVDAVAHVIGLPATPLRDALGGEGGLRLLPLDESAILQLAESDTGMVASAISAGVYPQQSGKVPTVAVPALLLATEELSREEAARLVRIVYEQGNDLLAQGSAQGSQVSVRNARRGLTVPLHVGAEQALGELEAELESASMR